MDVRHGIDLVGVERFKKTLERGGASFLNRVFTSSEQAYCEPMRMKHEHYAVRFAAKEAVMKVLKTKKDAGISYLEIEIKKQPSGKPFVWLSKTTQKKLNLPRKFQIEISLSHERDYAIASAVLVLP